MNAQTETALAGVDVDRRALCRALRLAEIVVDRRNTIPILAHVELRSGDAGLMIRATDLDTELTIPVPAEVVAPLWVTANGRDLGRLARAANGARMTFFRDGELTSVRSGAMAARFWTMPTEDFPAFQMPSDVSGRVTIGAEALLGMLDRAAHAISIEETRYYLNGVFLELDGDAGLNAVATDGHRMAVVGASVASGATWPEHGVIVRRRAVAALRALLAGLSDAVTITAAGTKIEFVTSAGTLRAKAIDGQFPAWRRVVPEGGKPATFARAAMLAAFNRVSALSSRNHGHAIKVTMDRGEAVFRASVSSEWELWERVPFDGPDLTAEFGVNYLYMRQLLAQVGGDVTVHVTDGAFPLRVKDAADPRALVILMPMRV
jgi:DNA polymerase-3 subunit beta